MSNLVLSNLTINGRPVGLFEESPFPYQTITIGNQTWMAEALTEDDGGEGIWVYHNHVINGYTYPTICMYNHAAAVRIAQTIPGWHLPTKAEVDTLVQYVNNGSYNSTLARKLKSTTGWSNNGTDDYGWNAKPLGMVRNNNYDGGGGESTIWEYDSYYRWYLTNTSGNGNESSSLGYSVRLIKDT